jgi:hypothetical protein
MQPPAAPAARAPADAIHVGAAAHRQLDHVGDQVAVLRFGKRDERGDIIGLVVDIGVGEQQIVGDQGGRGNHSLRHRPQLAAPSGRQRRGAHYGEARRCPDPGRGLRDCAIGSIGAGIVDHDDVNLPAEILLQERSDGICDDCSLVARRNDRHHLSGESEVHRQTREMPGDEPEPAMRQQQIEPDEHGHGGQGVDDHARVSLKWLRAAR